ncbi:FG-GAP repeat domain-containing protein [Streptomyces sp. NPDC059247]|uniref:FG-GAP repeat domain-containing protein n=1 Tax=Streptomyces sp. NPDC059247 TaxID=3346790 RepID=UPI0036AE54A7
MTPRTARRTLAAAITTVLATTALATAPAATAVPLPGAVPAASATEDPALTLVGTSLGPVVNLDSLRGQTELSWTLSHGNVDATVELTHKGTGWKEVRQFDDTDSTGSFGFIWHGNLFERSNHPGLPAPNGDYSWKLTAKPHDGTGPELKTGGDFKVVRSLKIHDFNDNGTPDLFLRDVNGRTMRVDTTYDYARHKVVEADASISVFGEWKSYRQLESVGDVAGTNAPDVIGIDTTGGLWFHAGTGAHEAAPLVPRVWIGGGWGVYTQLAGGSDLTGDGRADLVAVDKAGDLWLYKGTGKASAPFAPRKKTGFGWGIYNKITAVGNLAGGPAGDLVARDKNGVLWLYLGKGDGTFATRSRIGAGWNQYTHIIGIGDATRDGRADLYGIGPSNTVYIHPGSGHWRVPFTLRQSTDVLANRSYALTGKVF